MIETERLNIVPAVEQDINFIIEMEMHKDNKNFIWLGTYEQHLEEINDPNHLLIVFKEKNTNEKIGYALIHLNFTSNIFELRRIAISKKNQGYGKEALKAIIKYAFEQTETNRFWLDVYPDNEVGISLYESLGMVKEGILRENYRSERGYLDQIIYSILKSEYKGE